MKFKRTVCGATVAVALVCAASSASAAGLSGKSTTEGGSKPFCKGSTSISGSFDGTSIAIITPLAVGGSATVKGKVDKNGAFKISAQRFTFTGKATAKSVSGTWKGPSCYGSFSLR